MFVAIGYGTLAMIWREDALEVNAEVLRLHYAKHQKHRF